MEKNTAGKWVVFAYGLPDHASAGQAITGDAANITANIRIDGGAANAVDDVNPAELEDGYYIFDITAAEANGDLLSLHPASATANVQVIGVPGSVWTRPANFNALGIESDGDISGVVLVDTTTTNTDMRGTDSAALAASWTAARAGYVDNINGHTAQTGDNYARLGAPAGASVSADISVIDANVDAVLVDTNELQTDDIPGLISALDVVVDRVEADTQDIQARLPAALVSGRMDSNASAIAGDATAATNLSSSALGIVSGACEGTPTTTVIQTDLSEATDDHYIGRVVVFTSGSAAGQATDITDYTGATGTLTVTALTTAPSATDNFVIV